MFLNDLRLHVRGLIIAVVAFVAVTDGASANRLSVSRTFRDVWTGMEFSNSATQEVVRCPVTLEGTYNSSTFHKTVKAVIGAVTRARSANCTGGSVTIHQEVLPWKRTYLSFTGALPHVASVRALWELAYFEISTGTITCSARTEEAHNLVIADIVEESGAVTEARADESQRIPLMGGLCAFATGSVAGTATVTEAGGTNAVTLKLI